MYGFKAGGMRPTGMLSCDVCHHITPLKLGSLCVTFAFAIPQYERTLSLPMYPREIKAISHRLVRHQSLDDVHVTFIRVSLIVRHDNG